MGRLGLLAFLPLVGITAYAGISTSPDPIRPCVTEFSKGLSGRAGPGGMVSDPQGNLWASSGNSGHFLRFDPKTEKITQWQAPPGVSPHDPFPRSDGTIWFSDYNGGLVEFDPRAEKFTVFKDDIATGSHPHGIVWASDDRLYMAEQDSGLFKRFDPDTREFTLVTEGMPRNAGPHGILEVGEDYLWVALQFADKIGRFNLKTQRWDKFVDFPKNSGPHQIGYDPKRKQLVVTLQQSQQIGLYSLATGRVRLFRTSLDAISRATAISQRARNARLVAVTVDAAAKYAWITALEPGILRFDLDTHEILEVTCGVTLPSAGLVVVRSGNRIWFSEPFPGAFARVDERKPATPLAGSEAQFPAPREKRGRAVAEDELRLVVTVDPPTPNSSMAHTIKLTRLVRTEVSPPAAQTVIRLPDGAVSRVAKFPLCPLSKMQKSGADACPADAKIGTGEAIAGAGPRTFPLKLTFFAASIDRNPDGSARPEAMPGFVGVAMGQSGPITLPFAQVGASTFATDRPRPGDKAMFVISEFDLSIPARETAGGVALITTPPTCNGTWQFRISEIAGDGTRHGASDDVPCH